MATEKTLIVVFGEVLFDCFPEGEEVLGGAPFNVAWNLQAFGDEPVFISRIGNDPRGQKVVSEMRQWEMNLSQLQVDATHPTGQVEVALLSGEPHYTITTDCAYDFIDYHEIKPMPEERIVYHGTLGLRNRVARHALVELTSSFGNSIFVDVNLRDPWWKEEEVFYWLDSARWVKLNVDELRRLGFSNENLEQAMKELQDRFDLEQVILTCGADGAMVVDDEGKLYQVQPESVTDVVDTVGAGDAFASVYLHGLVQDWPIQKTLENAQKFASQVIGLRGATTNDKDFYDTILNTFKE
ncbi:carbohydrate kinase family protein [Hydrogenovibrio marinus]|uniref:Carbohydrate kinase n=1 Tax=Hydrogenovibrio marinus TaxID=28885 RepID=A0A066ZTJ4_HYDMR|nr:carbohydrate kinase [Hydrogenovibrio marinus]KDN96807.1 carbohydrate kinase [Hydrogenovibrio marinus]BBN59064.1 fructokinase [Hydrogenovibrio marinus]